MSEIEALNSMDSTLRAVVSHRPDVPQPLAAVSPEAPPDPVAADPADPLGLAPVAGLLAEAALHTGAPTPFCIAILGPAGSGKSALMDRVIGAAGQLAETSREAGLASSFVAETVIVRVDASRGGDPDTLLAAAVYDRIAETHPSVAAELAGAGADPRTAARAADDALDVARRRLDEARSSLDELTGRDARLADTVLESPGSAVDLYARSKRSRLEGSQRTFGFRAADPVMTYKALVREAADVKAPLARAGLSVRALWAYPGQLRLLIIAALLLVLAWGCGVARDTQGVWLDALRNSNEKAMPAADWIGAHLPWLGTLQTLALLGAVLAVTLNVLRAARFALPIARGVDLLGHDLDGRRRDLAGLIAHQTRRVDALASEAEAAAERAADAQRRAGVSDRTAASRPAAFSQPGDIAAAMFRALGERLAVRESAAGPRRLLVAIDGLDALSAATAAGVLSAAHRLLGAGTVTLVAADPAQLASGWGETDPAGAAAQFARCIQVPYRIELLDGSEAARRHFALGLIEGGSVGPGKAANPPVLPDPRRSSFDEPWREREAETVAAIAPLAGETPRAIANYVALYRIARADARLKGAAAPVFTALALALALDTHGLPEDWAALEQASRGDRTGEVSPMLRDALAAAREASGVPVELGQAQQALAVARSYTRRP